MIDAGFAADSEPSGAIELVYGCGPPIPRARGALVVRLRPQSAASEPAPLRSC